MPNVLDLLQCLDEQPVGAVIYAARPWTAASDAVAVAFDAPPSDLPTYSKSNWLRTSSKCGRPGRVPFVGDFRELEQGGGPDGLSLRSAVRAEEPGNARELVKYLQNGALLAATTTLVRDVLALDNPVIGGLHVLMDGHWFWHSDLAHYVEYYHLALDAQFIAHAQANDWTVPQLDDTELVALGTVLFGDDTD